MKHNTGGARHNERPGKGPAPRSGDNGDPRAWAHPDPETPGQGQPKAGAPAPHQRLDAAHDGVPARLQGQKTLDSKIAHAPDPSVWQTRGRSSSGGSSTHQRDDDRRAS